MVTDAGLESDTLQLEPYKIGSLPDSLFYVSSFLSGAEQERILSSLPKNRWVNLTHRRLQAWPSVLSKSNTLLDAPLPAWLADPITKRFETSGLFDESPHRKPNHVLINEYNPGEGIMPHEDGGAYWPIVATVSLGASIVLDIYPKNEGPDLKESNASLIGKSRAPEEHGNGGQSGEPSRPSQPRWRILQEPGSLLVTTGPLYAQTLHGITDVEEDCDLDATSIANWDLLDVKTRSTLESDGGRSARATRTSLTYRDVLKVSKAGSRILGLNRR